jgi:hypothetical protein
LVCLDFCSGYGFEFVGIGQDHFNTVPVKQVGDPIPSICGFDDSFVGVAKSLKIFDYFIGMVVYFLLLDDNAFLIYGCQVREAFVKINAGIIHGGPPYWRR